MTQINAYLTFSGNCREAMTFYQSCLGGELAFQTIGESPLSDKMPQQMKDCILHSTLTKGSLLLMGSDMVPPSGLARGNAVTLALLCSSEAEIKSCFASLAAGGTIDHPLETTFWGALLGDLTDKFGNHWLLNYEKNKHMKKINIIYWIATGLFAFFMLGSAIPDILSMPIAIQGMHAELGYPVYFIPFIGVVKLLGVIALFIPGFPRVREWAYAGFAFDLLGALYSVIAVKATAPENWLPMFLPIAIGALSYIYYHKRLKAQAK